MRRTGRSNDGLRLTERTKENQVKRILILAGIVVLAGLAAGCAATTTLNASQGGTTITVKESTQTDRS